MTSSHFLLPLYLLFTYFVFLIESCKRKFKSGNCASISKCDKFDTLENDLIFPPSHEVILFDFFPHYKVKKNSTNWCVGVMSIKIFLKIRMWVVLWRLFWDINVACRYFIQVNGTKIEFSIFSEKSVFSCPKIVINKVWNYNNYNSHIVL